MKKLIAVFGLAALAACGGGDKAEGDANTTVDTSATVVPGTDTVSTPVVVPTQDTAMTTTTTTTQTDTMQGQATGAATTTTTVPATTTTDTTKRP
jgi:hypothetical protein